MTALTAADHAPSPGSLSAFWRVASPIGDLLGALGIVLLIPFGILAFAIPIALFVRFLLWITRML